MHRGEGSMHAQDPMLQSSTTRDAAAAQLRPGGLQRAALERRGLNPSRNAFLALFAQN